MFFVNRITIHRFPFEKKRTKWIFFSKEELIAIKNPARKHIPDFVKIYEIKFSYFLR